MSLATFLRRSALNRMTVLATALGGLASGAAAESSLVIRVDYPTQWLTLNHRVLQSLVQSDTVAGEVQRQLQQKGLLKDSGRLELDAQPLQERDHGRAGWAEIVADLSAEYVDDDGGESPAAEREALRIAPNLLRSALDSVAAVERERSQQQLAAAETQVNGLTQQLAEAQARRGELLQKAGGTLPQRSDLLQMLSDLEQRRAGAAHSLASLALREAAITQQIQKLAQQSQAEADANTLVQELVQLLKLREDRATQVRKLAEQGQASDGDVAAALDELIHARVRLEEQRQKAVEPARAEIQRLSQMLRNLAIERAEMEADRAAVEQRLKDVAERRVLELSDQYEREFREQIDFLESQLGRLRIDLFELRQADGNFRAPQLQIIGGQGGASAEQ